MIPDVNGDWLRPRLGSVTRLLAVGVLGLAGVFSAKAAPTEVIIPGDHVYPESITATSDGTLIMDSLAEGNIYRVRPGANTAEEWIKQAPNGLLSIIGVLADESSGTLWACSSDLSPD